MKRQCEEDDEHEFGEFTRVGKDVSFPALEQVRRLKGAKSGVAMLEKDVTAAGSRGQQMARSLCDVGDNKPRWHRTIITWGDLGMYNYCEGLQFRCMSSKNSPIIAVTFPHGLHVITLA